MATTSPTLIRGDAIAHAAHLYRSALSLNAAAPSTSAHLGYHALSIQAYHADTQALHVDARLADDFGKDGRRRQTYGHIELCHACGSCLLPGENAQRAVGHGTNLNKIRQIGRRFAQSDIELQKLKRPSKRRKLAWTSPKAPASDLASETNKPASSNAATSKITSGRAQQKARKQTSDLVHLTCNRCGRRTRMDLEPTQASMSKPPVRVVVPQHNAETERALSYTGFGPSGQPSAPTFEALPGAAPSSSNVKSKKRAKARKKGGLTAEIEHQKTGYSNGLDLMDFMKAS